MTKKKAKGKIVCDRCKKEWPVVKTRIQTQKFGNMDLQFFLCPRCNKLFRVGLRDEKWYELLEDLKKSKKRLEAANNGRITDARTIDGLLGACEKKRARMQQYDEVLQSKYQGTFTRDKDGTIIYLP